MFTNDGNQATSRRDKGPTCVTTQFWQQRESLLLSSRLISAFELAIDLVQPAAEDLRAAVVLVPYP